jgi:Tfp pilus assembly protein PilN
MANKINEILNKNLEPIFKKMGKINLKKENILGISFKDNEIQIIDLIYKKKSWQAKEYSYQQIAGIGKDQDIFTASTYLADQVKNALDSVSSKTKDVAISLDTSNVTTYNLQVPIMEPKDLEDSVQFGGFWEGFDETPDSLEEFETSYQIISSNEELGVMNVILLAIEKKVVEAYINIFRIAGLNPVIVDMNPSSQMNAMVAALGKESFDTPVVIFNYLKDASYLTIASNKGFSVTDISINEADQVLLDTIEEIEDITTEFWDEIFERLASQIKQGLIEFETQQEEDPISLINVVTDKSITKNLFIGLEKQLGEIVIKNYDPEESIVFEEGAKKYLDALPNKSKIINCIGAGVRRLNCYNADNENELYGFNLLPRANQLKINRKAKSFASTCYGLSCAILLLGFSYLIPFEVLQVMSNSGEVANLKGVLNEVQTKQKLSIAYSTKVDKLESKVFTAKAFGTNKQSSSHLIESLATNVPKDIRITSFKISNGKNILMNGVSKDDASVIKMTNLFSNSPSVQNVKLDNMAGFTEQDKPQLYSEPGKTKPESFPNEMITKKFTVSLVMRAIEGEVFNNEKIYGQLTRQKKRR